MTSSSAIHVSAGDSRVAIRRDSLRLALPFSARLPGIGVVRNPLVARAAIGSKKDPGCSTGHAR